jgi:hypothetical protein
MWLLADKMNNIIRDTACCQGYQLGDHCLSVNNQNHFHAQYQRKTLYEIEEFGP